MANNDPAEEFFISPGNDAELHEELLKAGDNPGTFKNSLLFIGDELDVDYMNEVAGDPSKSTEVFKANGSRYTPPPEKDNE